jgi:hypothetical protein
VEPGSPIGPSTARHFTTTPASEGTDRVRRLADALDRVARTVRTLLVIRAVAWILAAAVGAALLVALVDLGLRLPAVLRGVLLAAGIGGVAAGVWTMARPAWRARPGRAALAHRIERIEPALAGRIAPAVDLLPKVDEPGETGAIARAGVERAGIDAGRVNAWEILRWSGAGGSLGALLAGVAAIGLLAVTTPDMVRIGAARVLTPWTDASWPKRYGLTDLTGVTVHPADEALAVRVAVGPGDPGSRVRVEWRVGDEREGRTPMAAQPGRTEQGRPYERLIDPVGIRPGDDEVTMRYRVVSPDDRTGWTRVRLVRPPEVRSARVRLDPPAHAAGAPGLAGFRTGDRDLPTGDATLGPVLEGTALVLTWTFSSAVRAVEPEAWSDAPLDITRPDDHTVAVALTPGSPVRVTPRVENEFGLGVREPVAVGIDVRADGLPGVAIVAPAADEVVTPQARLDLAAEAGDDVGVTALRLEGTLLRPPAGSAGAGPEPVGPGVALGDAGLPAAKARAEVRATIAPTDLGAAPGDEIVLRAFATDTRGLAGEAVSGERRLRVVSGADLAARLRNELNPLARLLRRTDDQQGALADRLRRGGEDAEPLVREQIALGDAVAAAARSVRSLDDARARNALDDPALESLLRDLNATLDEASDAARSAARAIEEQRDQDAQEDQRTARDRIGEALSMLDRGEDAFLARRAVERIREQLAETRGRTEEIGRRTAGQEASGLSPQDRSALDRLAADQDELADRAREALEELTRRAESLERDDPAQAEALRRAAEQGRAGAVGQLIEQAAQQTGENQTGQAQQSQDEALERLDEMLEQMDEASALRDTALRRRLATLIASITQLVEAQRAELDALARVREQGAGAGLADGMIALRSNTLGVIEEASAALAELRLIAESLREAETAQAAAAVKLRRSPPEIDGAEVDERASLGALERALEEAERQDDRAAQREQDRKKAELRRAYRDALEQQTALRDEAAPLLGRDLTRRERVEARRLGAAQSALADALVAVREGTAELSEAPVFALAHQRLDEAMRDAADALAGPAPARGVALDQQQAVAILASLVEVLADNAGGQDEDFQDAGGSGGGEGGGSGGEEEQLIPPIAELRLLRDLQHAAMETTRRLAESPDPDADAARLARLGDLQRLLAERGAELIEKLSRQAGPDADPAPGPDVDQPGPPDRQDPPAPQPPGPTGEQTPAESAETATSAEAFRPPGG